MTTPSAYQVFYADGSPERHGRAEMPAQRKLTERWLSFSGNNRPDAVVLELGAGQGALKDVHANWMGLEFSFRALARLGRSFKCINGDMQMLPLRDGTVDFLFTFATIEHVPYPERVLAEVERVLKPGGVALLEPAWYCRSWASKGLPVKRFRELNLRDKLAKASIPLRDTLLWRSLFALPARASREVLSRLSGKPARFTYHRLTPNLTEYVYTDCDAFTSMDAHAAIVYFRSRGWKLLSHPTLWSQFFVRYDPVVVRKPASS